jgi:ABC-2 type transport system permease protein
VFGFLLYHFNILHIGLSLIPLMLNLFIFGFVLAIFINAIIIRFGSSAQVLAFGMAILVQPISAVYYPVSVLPQFLQYVSYLLPSSYVFESLRTISNGGTFDTQMFLTALLLNIIYLFLASWFFVSMFKKVKMMGKLLKIQD